MTPEAQQAQRRAIADAMGFKDADFLKWHDGMYEAQQWLIDRDRNLKDDCWSRYIENILEDCNNDAGRAIHATVAQKQEAFLKAIGASL